MKSLFLCWLNTKIPSIISEKYLGIDSIDVLPNVNLMTLRKIGLFIVDFLSEKFDRKQ